MHLIVAAGSTDTALIEGISAAGASPDLLAHTPSADAEILVYGEPTLAPVTPVSPTGCPTPAAITRAVREVQGFDVTVLDAGLARQTTAPTVDLGASPGSDVRDPMAVPDAEAIYDAGTRFGRAIPDEAVWIGETIPGGTTTALGVLRALGEPGGVSSSLPENPIARKDAVVDEGLAASDLAPGECAGAPLDAIRAVGDPVQAAIAGVVAGALDRDASVILAGGTQLVAAAALVRHAGYDDPLSLATTSFVAADPSVDLDGACGRLDLDLTVTDPGFDARAHVAMVRYVAGEAKEGVGMGGALAHADRHGMLAAVRDRIPTVCDRLGVGDRTHADRPHAGEQSVGGRDDA